MTGGNVTSVNLASSSQKKVQSTSDILKQIESTFTENSHDNKYKQEELSSRILGKISQHEAAFGDQHLPRQRLPKVDAVLLDRYQAARRNVLVLGAIKQASQHASRPNTHRSGKSSHAPTAAAVAAASDAGSCLGDGASAAAAERGLNSTFTSFAGSRAGSPSVAGREGDISPEASGYIGAEASQLSVSSRKMRHQASGRSGVSSFAGSCVTDRSRLKHVSSSLSTGSGRTQHSEATYTSCGSKYSRATSHWGRKTPRKAKPAKPKPGRVTTAMAQYGSQDDWMSKTLLKHYLASVIQARWRGYQVRKRWADKEGRLAYVEEQKARLQAEQLHQQRLQELQQKLQARRAKQQAQATAAAVAAAASGNEGGLPSEAAAAAAPPTAAVSVAGSRVVSARRMPGSRVMSAAVGGKNRPCSGKAPGSYPYAAEGWPGSDSDSGWSDIELDDVASIKFRAVTPPWQKVSEQACMGQRLRRRMAAAAAAATGQALPEEWGVAGDEGFGAMLGAAWESSSSECGSRLQEVSWRGAGRSVWCIWCQLMLHAADSFWQQWLWS
ncbi:hypothetical protein OEZ86_001967 [Tetradesmus obliquus]|nr:hypothetical protein OEZ86_001967 [Tetradesmus obliquus]